MRVLVLVFLFLLVLLSIRYFTFYSTVLKHDDGQKITFEGVVVSVPSQETRYQRLTVADPYGLKLYLTAPLSPEYYYGQKVRVIGSIKEAVLDNEKTILTMSFPTIDGSNRRGMWGGIVDSFYLMSHMMRSHILSYFEAYLPQNSAAFLSGVVLGVDNGMQKEYRETLIQLGVIHVIAASGMNVSIIAGLFFGIFLRLFHRKTAVLLSVLAIAFYTVLAGGQASIVRAAIMGSIAFSAGLLGRQYFSFLALFLTGIIMLFISPLYLFEIGFQLSFLSTLGLLLLPRYFERYMAVGVSRLRLLSFFKDDLLLTLSAQIMTIPVLFYHFGEYGLLSLPVNLLVLWVIPFLMILGGIAAVLSFILPILGGVFLYLAAPFLFYFEFVINLFAMLTSVFKMNISLFGVFGYYFLLAGIILFLFRKKESS